MIEINNLTTNSVNQEFLREVAKKVLISENKEKLELSIVLIGSAKIKELNRKYRRKNKITDVLSFLYNGSGEIVICPQEVGEKAEDLAKVLIHGILHLLGYDHEGNEAGAEEMKKKEEYYLSQT